MKRSREVYVGLFVLVAAILFVFLTVSLRNMDLFSNRRTYYISFVRVKQLDLGAPVLVSGIKAGEVTKIQYIGGDHPVLVTARIDKTVKLYSDARAIVSPAAVIGDTTINIQTGKAGQETKLLLPGSELQGEDMPQLEELASEVSQELVRALQAISAIINDLENREALKTTLHNLSEATGKLDQTLAMVNERFEPVMREMETTTSNLNGLLTEAKGLTAQANEEIRRAGEKLNLTAESWNAAAGTLKTQIDQTGQQIQQAAQRVDTAIASQQEPVDRTLKELEATLRNLREISERINRGDGSLGRLINNPQIYDDVSQITRGVNQTLTGRRENVFPLPSAEPGANAPAGITAP